MGHLALCFLGPFHAALDGKPVAGFESNKARALLAYLAVEADRPHPRDTLAGLLWPDLPDSTALANLRHALANLRRILHDHDPACPFLLITRDTIRFNPAADFSLDADVLRDLPPLSAGPALEQVAASYCSPFLDGLSLGDCPAFEEWLLLLREQFSRLALAALRVLAEHSERHSQYAAAEFYARKQLEMEPWDEEAHRQLMRALAWSGNRNGALAQFEVCRRALADGLGVIPSRETTALYERICQGIPRSLAANLPVPLTSFVGRDQERARVRELLAATRLLTLTGAAGSGKTRLALQVAAELVDGNWFEDGVRWVDLATLNEPSLVLLAIAKALGLREWANQPLCETLQNALRRKQLLLVLDNCEHLLEACATIAENLLSACAGLKILATSREALSMLGETTWCVPALALPDSSGLPSLQEVGEYDAIRLFVERASAGGHPFRLTERNAPVVAQICRRLDGLPLAIELAAARLKALSPEQVASRLDDRFSLLTSGNRTALPRHQTLRAAMDWSYALLAVEEQALLQGLAVFEGGFEGEAAQAVAADGATSACPILNLLSQLVGKSLVLVDRNADSPRYYLLETIQEYAEEKLVEARQAERARDAHLDFFYRLAQEMEPKLKRAQQREAVEWFEREHDNLRAALTWSLASGKGETALHLATLVGTFWNWHGYLSEGSDWLARAFHAAGSATKLARSRALVLLADLSSQRGDHEQARAFWEQGLELGRELDDRSAIAAALIVGGTEAHRQGQLEQAVRLLEEGLALFREQGTEGRWGTADALLWLTDVRLRQGELERAAPLCQESLSLFRELGDKWGIGFSLGNAGEIARRQGNAQQAARLFAEALGIHWESGDQGDIPYVLEALAIVATVRGQHERAARLWGAAENLREAISAPVPTLYANDYSCFIVSARAQLPRRVWARAWGEGRSMTTRQAVEYALEDK